MKFTQEQFERAAKTWEADYEALKGIEAGNGTVEEARALFRKGRPGFTWDKTMIQLILLERNGYIEGVRGADGHVMKPMKVKITQKGHEYFKRMIEETKALAGELA
jgi:hypothetical protein